MTKVFFPSPPPRNDGIMNARAHERTRIIEFQNFEIYVDRDYRVNNVQDCYYQLTVKYATNALRVQRLFQTYDRPYIYAIRIFIQYRILSGNKITITIARRLRNVITVVITHDIGAMRCDYWSRIAIHSGGEEGLI